MDKYSFKVLIFLIQTFSNHFGKKKNFRKIALTEVYLDYSNLK